VSCTNADEVQMSDRWFGRCLAFVKIGELEGILTHSYEYENSLSSYPEQSHEIPVFKWWPEKKARERSTRLTGDIIHTRIVPLQSVKARICMVPDWSFAYVNLKPKHKDGSRTWKQERFLMIQDYILF